MAHATRWLGIINLLALLHVHPAIAAKRTPSHADTLFTTAVAKMNAKDYDTACPMLTESYRLDPTPGVLFTLAFCEYETNKLVSARAKFAEFLQSCKTMPTTQQDRFRERMTIASDKLHLLEKEVPKLTLTLPMNVPAGLQVFLDEKELSSKAFNQPMELDVGDHIVRTDVPTRFPLSQKIRLERAANITHQLKLPDPAIQPEVADSMRKPATALHVGGGIALGIGGAGFVTWAATGSWALANKDNVTKNCNWSGCNSDGLEALAKGRVVANIASTGLGIGIAGAAIGTVMLLVNRKREANDAAKMGTQISVMNMGLAGTGLSVKGVF